MLFDDPRLFMMHFWAVTDPEKLAAGLKAALDKTNSKMQSVCLELLHPTEIEIYAMRIPIASSKLRTGFVLPTLDVGTSLLIMLKE